MQRARRKVRRLLSAARRVQRRALTAGEAKPARPEPGDAWRAIERHLDAFPSGSTTELAAYVDGVLNSTKSPVIVVALARHPRSADRVRAWLDRTVLADLTSVRARLKANELFAAAVAGAARLVLEPDAAQRAADVIQHHFPAASLRYFQFLDGIGYRLAERSSATGPAPAVRRLIISDRFEDAEMAALLIPGCDHATFLATTDTFGESALAHRRDWTGAGDLTIEHIRGRITRFSPEYIALHEATAAVAEQVVARIAELPGVIAADDEAFVKLTVADFIFFRALRIRAIETLLADPAFDQVVIAIDKQDQYSEFVRMLAGIDALAKDPRVNVVSIAADVKDRVNFWKVLDAITAPSRAVTHRAAHLSADVAAHQFAELARQRAQSIEPPDEPWVLLTTAAHRPYDHSTAVFAHELAVDHPVRILEMSGKGAAAIKAAVNTIGRSDRIVVSEFTVDNFRDNALTHVLRGHLQPLREALLAGASTPFERNAAASLNATFDAVVRGVVMPALFRAQVFAHWFEDWRSSSRLPVAVALAPQRDSAVASITPAARRVAVPSMAFEPNIVTPDYCRYTRVAADFYGVMSDYFVAGATGKFGLTPDRVRVIGSPRLIAPPGYDPSAERARARAAYAAKNGFDFAAPVHMTFFCQPSGWEHVEPLWEMLLDTVAKTDTHLFFKPHMEEAPNRVDLYRQRIAERGLTHRVTELSGDAAEAVALADAVATAYSTAAFDAAIRRTPVVCVAAGDVEYPVDICAMAGATMARSADELITQLTDLARDRSAAQARVDAWLEKEHQFVVGPGPGVRQLLHDAVERGAQGVRPVTDIPRSLFTDGPHPTFPV